MENNTPNVAQWFVLLVSAGIGAWLLLRGWQQFRRPQDARMLGMGWFVKLTKTGLDVEDQKKADEAWSNPVLIRFFAGCSMGVGIMMISLPLMVWILLRLS